MSTSRPRTTFTYHNYATNTTDTRTEPPLTYAEARQYCWQDAVTQRRYDDCIARGLSPMEALVDVWEVTIQEQKAARYYL